MIRFRHFAALAAIAMGFVAVASTGTFAADCCCCPPPPVHQTLCVNPPCSCCSQTVNVCVPGCCVGEPSVCWRSGIFGRQIGTYTWACGHSVKVVVTRRGDAIVRG